MSKYIIEKKKDEVIFREITLNIEEYGDELVELTKDELDQQLEEYSNQDLYVSIYYQIQTKKHGIQFVRGRFTVDLWDEKPKYKFKPIEKDVNLEREYYIKQSLIDVEVWNRNEYMEENPGLAHFLTEAELIDKVREFLNRGLNVYFGDYEYKRKKWRFKPQKTVKEVTEDGQILYR